MLTTQQITDTLKDMRYFCGVFPINRLSFVLLPKPGAVIINLDDSYNPGSHWVSVYITEKSEGYYFDSFGRHPPAAIQAFIERNTKNWTWNREVYQADDSTYCGYYCILFVLYGQKLYKLLQPCMTDYNEKIINTIFCL